MFTVWLLYSLLSAILTGCVPILVSKPTRSVGAGRSAIIRSAFVLFGSGILMLMSKTSLFLDDRTVWMIFVSAGFFDAAAWFVFYRAIAESSTEIAVIQEKSCVPFSILLSCLLTLQFPSLAELTAIALFTVGILYSARGSLSRFPLLSAICTTIQMQLSKTGLDRIGSQESALFLRSAFSLLFLFLFLGFSSDRSIKHDFEAVSKVQSILFLTGSGICAFFAWKFNFSALSSAPASYVQAVTKLNFLITGIYFAIRKRSINRKLWFGYITMTVGTLVLIA